MAAGKIIFAADTAAFTEPVKRSASEVRALSAELSKTEKAAKSAFREAQTSAKAAGATSEQLRKLEQDHFRELLAIQSARKKVTAEVVTGGREEISTEEAKQRAIQRTAAAVAQYREEIRKTLPLEQEQHYQPSRIQKNSALVRGGGLRAAENAASLIPGFDRLAEVAFPVLGLATLGVEVGRGVEKFIELRREAMHASDAIREGFGELHEKAQTTVVDLDLQSAKLQEEIDKLSGHPGNGLEVALATARKAADALANSLRQDRKEMDALFKEQSVGFFKSFLSGNASTTKQEENLDRDSKKFEADIARTNNDFDDRLSRTADEKQRKALEKQRASTIQGQFGGRIGSYQREIQRLQKEQAHNETARTKAAQFAASQGHAYIDITPIDNTAKITELQGVIEQYQDRQAVYSRQLRVADQAEQVGALKGAKERGELAKKGQRDALEASRKAFEEQKRQWENEHSAWSVATVRSAADDVLFWNARAAASKSGSEAYLFAVREENNAYRKMMEGDLKQQKEYDALLQSFVRSGAKFQGRNDDEAFEKTVGSGGRLAASMQALSDAQRDAYLQGEEASVKLQEQAGVISKLDAAYRLAAIHAQQYADAADAIQQKRDSLLDSDPERQTKLNDINREQARLDGQRQIAQMQDQAAIVANSLQTQVQGITSGLVNGINGDLSTALMNVGRRGQHHIGRDLGNAVRNEFRSAGGRLAQSGLERIESGLFGLGGKPTGAKGNPFHVVIDGAGNVIGTAAASVGGSAGGDGDSTWGKLAGMIVPFFGGARAVGGGVQPGRFYLAGENGPELFAPSSSGYMHPADATANMLSGPGGGMTMHVDARGSQDTAQTRAAARRGALEGHAAAAQQYGDSQRESQRRKPLSSR